MKEERGERTEEREERSHFFRFSLLPSSFSLLPFALLLAALGWWLPWVVPRSGAAALVLLGLDLGDFWKFTNEWRVLGLFRWERLCFFLPPPLAAMGLAGWLAGGRGRARWLLLPLLLGLSVVVLPDYERVLPALKEGNPLSYDTAQAGPHGEFIASLAREFSFQLRLVVGSLLTVALIPAWARLPRRGRALLVAGVALTSAMLPAWALWRTWPILQGLYGGGALLGPGVILTSVGFGLAALAALLHSRTT